MQCSVCAQLRLNDPTVPHLNDTYGIESRVVDDYGFVCKFECCRQISQGIFVAPDNGLIRNVVSAGHNAKSDAFDIACWRIKGNEQQVNTVAGLLCLMHDSEGMAAAESRFEHEIRSRPDQVPQPLDCQAAGHDLSCSDRDACREIPLDVVRVYKCTTWQDFLVD